MRKLLFISEGFVNKNNDFEDAYAGDRKNMICFRVDS